MKNLLLMMAFMLGSFAFANGSGLGETEVDCDHLNQGARVAKPLNANGECDQGYVKQGEQCIPVGSSDSESRDR